MALALTLIALIPLQPAPRSLRAGTAYEYRPGLMARVAKTRHLPLLPYVDGYASTPRCDHVGDLLLAEIAGQPLLLQQVDCSAPADRAYQRRALDLVIEVNHSLAAAQGWAYYGRAGGPGHAPARLRGWLQGAYP